MGELLISLGIDNFKEGLETLAYLVTIVSLIALWITYTFSRKQIHLSTIAKCIQDYRNLYHKFDDKYQNPLFLGQYLDLVNEELFYIEKGYLPKEVANEWIDGMIDYLPFITANDFVKSSKFLQLEDIKSTEKALFVYPRILHFITIRNIIDYETVFLPLNDRSGMFRRNSERKKLIKALRKNLRSYKAVS